MVQEHLSDTTRTMYEEALKVAKLGKVFPVISGILKLYSGGLVEIVD